MSYDIPDEIKYREKILLNLDLKQIGYAIAFGALALMLYQLPLRGLLRLVLPSVALVTGLAFVFFNAEERALDIIAYYRNIRKASPQDLNAQHFIGIEAIRNDAFYLANGDLKAVLEVEPINFQLLGDERKKSLILNYREFLNQLSTPLQILVRTTDVSLADYFNSQEKKFQDSSREFSSLYTDFRIFEENFIEGNSVKERHYYLIVSSSPKTRLGRVAASVVDHKEPALKQLNQQVEILTGKLQNCGLEARRLRDDELTSLLLSYSEFNKKEEAETEQKGKPKPEKEEKPKNLFWFMITPFFDIRPGYAKVNDTYHRIVKVAGYPRTVDDGWLESFLGNNEGYDISLHIHPSTITQTLVMLHNQIIKQTADLVMSTAKGTPNPALEIKHKDTMRIYEQLYKGEEKLFHVSLYVDNKEATLEKLDLLTEKCNANLNSMLMIPRTASYRMAEGIKSSLPLGTDALASDREFLTSPLGATFPFISPASTKREGIMLAHEETTLNPLFVDFDSMSNKHFFILGISGSGKSYSAKYLTIQHLLNEEARVYVLDPNGEYNDLTAKLKGEVIELSKDSSSMINVFDLGNEDFSSKMLSLISVFDIISGGLTEGQKGVLNEALNEVYKRSGIEYNKPATWSKSPPTFSDFKQVLEEMLTESAARGVEIKIVTGRDFSSADLSNVENPFSKFIISACLNKPGGAAVKTFFGSQKNLTYSVHAKFMVFDEKKAYLGSANITQRSLSANVEMGIVFTDAKVAILVKAFKKIWEAGKEINLTK